MKKPSGKLFLNYRRDDNSTVTHAIAQSLMLEYQTENVFFDRQKIRPGRLFPKDIDKSLDECAILIVIIGKKWLDLLNQRSTFDVEDFVVSEIGYALAKGKVVLPVMLDDTNMPRPSELPDKIRSLSYVNATRFSTSDIINSTKILIRDINALLPPPIPPKRWSVKVALIATFLIAAFLIAGYKNSYELKVLYNSLFGTDLIDLNTLRSKIMYYTAAIQNDPVNVSELYNDSIKKYVTYGNEKVLPHRQDMNLDLAFGNKLYGSSLILNSIQNRSINKRTIKSAYILFAQSRELESQLWISEMDNLIYNYFKDVANNSEECNLKDDKTIQQIRGFAIELTKFGALMSKDGSDKAQKATNNLIDPKDGIIDDVFSDEEVLNFFNSYMINESYYLKDLIGATDIYLRNSGGGVDNPRVVQQKGNIYLVSFSSRGANNRLNYIDWEVDMNLKTIKPKSEAAEVLLNSMRASK